MEALWKFSFENLKVVKSDTHLDLSKGYGGWISIEKLTFNVLGEMHFRSNSEGVAQILHQLLGARNHLLHADTLHIHLANKALFSLSNFLKPEASIRDRFIDFSHLI